MKMWSIFRRHSVATLGLLTTLAFAPLSSATLIAPGTGATAISGVTLPGGGTIAASVTNNTVTTTQSGDTLTVTYSEWVYQETGGTLDFIIQATNTGAPGQDFIDNITASGFAGNGLITTNVGFNASAPVGSTIVGGIDPMQGSRLPGNGNVVAFLFDSNIIPVGSQTDYLIIQTNATQYIPGTVSFQDGVTVTGAGFGVAPEPGSVGLLLGGLFGLGLLATRRFRAQQS